MFYLLHLYEGLDGAGGGGGGGGGEGGLKMAKIWPLNCL